MSEKTSSDFDEMIDRTKSSVDRFLDSFTGEDVIKKSSGKYNCFYPGMESADVFNSRIHSLDSGMERTDVYVHLPYCTRRCSFCAYHSKMSMDDSERLVSSILREISFYRDSNYLADNIMFGGGTPTLFSLEDISRIYDRIEDVFELDHISDAVIESHPELVRQEGYEEYLRGLHRIGFDELSVGVESFNQGILDRMNRGHTVEEAVELVKTAKKIFDRVRVDLIYGMDGQSLSDWFYTVGRAIDLDVNDVSAYMFINSEDSVDSPVDERRMNIMQLFFMNAMEENGYYRGGFNATEFKYVKEKELAVEDDADEIMKIIGIGPSAYSTTDRYNSVNEWNNTDYMKRVRHQGTGTALINRFDGDDLMVNHLLHGILFQARIENDFFVKEFGEDIFERYSDVVDFLANNGLVRYADEDNLELTRKGMLYTNQIASFFVPVSYYKDYFSLRDGCTDVPEKYHEDIINSPFGFNLSKKVWRFLR